MGPSGGTRCVRLRCVWRAGAWGVPRRRGHRRGRLGAGKRRRGRGGASAVRWGSAVRRPSLRRVRRGCGVVRGYREGGGRRERTYQLVRCASQWRSVNPPLASSRKDTLAPHASHTTRPASYSSLGGSTAVVVVASDAASAACVLGACAATAGGGVVGAPAGGGAAPPDAGVDGELPVRVAVTVGAGEATGGAGAGRGGAGPCSCSPSRALRLREWLLRPA